VALLGAGGGRRGTGGPDRAKKAAASRSWAKRLFWAIMGERKMGCRMEFWIYWKIRDSNQGDLNIFKSNLNWIQNRINSNKLFEDFSNLEVLEIGLNIKI
jgi:hypothetical protein